MSVADIGKRIGLTRSSMFRLAYTLEHMGFVEEVPDSKLLRLGARVLNIGYAYLASQTLIELARPDLELLRDRTSVSSHLAILDRARDPVPVVHPDPLRLPVEHERRHAPAGLRHADGLAAARRPLGARARRACIRRASFVPLTEQTPRNVGELAQRIATAVAAGHAISHGAVEPGGSSIAAPIRDRDGRVVAAIDISAPDSAFAPGAFETRDVREVTDTAARISARLGYVDQPRRSDARPRSQACGARLVDVARRRARRSARDRTAAARARARG